MCEMFPIIICFYAASVNRFFAFDYVSKFDTLLMFRYDSVIIAWGRSYVVDSNPNYDPGFYPLAWQFFCPSESTLVQTLCTVRTHIYAHVKDPISICRKRVDLKARDNYGYAKILPTLG